MSRSFCFNQSALIDAYWRTSNYLTIGQIYLQDNPLLCEPRVENIRPRRFGHWRTSAGQNFVCVNLNRLITKTDAQLIYSSDPDHGGPALVAQTYPKVLILNFIRAFRETLTACESVVVLNKRSRYHLCIEAVGRSLRMQLHARKVIEWCDDTLESHRKYVAQHLEDMPEISQW